VALLAAHLGLVDQARSAAEEGIRVARDAGHLLAMGLNVFVLGFLEHSLGNADAAHARFGPMLEAARAGGFDEPAAAWWLPSEIEALIVLGELEQAASLTDWMEERARAIERVSGLASGARCRALLAAADGRVDEALTTCDEALALHERVDARFERARTLFAQGQIARRARKWGVARDALDGALTAFEALGARLWADRARDEAGRIGGRPPSPVELTETERQIADLVASGRTNREVAAALFVSPKTVSSSLGRVYRKLGVASRTEMAARLRGDPAGD
jgi:DNA-binding CsgD family transcriptional regulator